LHAGGQRFDSVILHWLWLPGKNRWFLLL